jgi:glyoxylase-like metal-dependent hydrolase (beta-lactamase superfamily II)
MLHWVLRRHAMAAGAGVDMSQPIEFTEVAEGIHQIRGSSHHALVIATGDGLVVVDATLYPSRSRHVIDALQSRFPERAISHLVLTHHHSDHNGGLVPFAESGAELVVAGSRAEHLRGILASHGLAEVAVSEVDQRRAIRGIDRPIELIPVPNSHSAAMLAVHIPNADHLFNADLYSPGRASQHPLWASELYQALRWYGLTDVTISGGHGQGTEPFAALARWVRNHGRIADLEP